MRAAAIGSVFIGSLLVTGSVARGEDASKVRVGVTLVPTPIGLLEVREPGTAEEGVRSGFAFGVMPVVDFALHRNVFVGLAPSYTFHVRAVGADPDVQPGNELDILLRLGGGANVVDRLYLYGYLAPGYSFTRDLPNNTHSRGPVLGFHAGGMFDATARFFVNAELGYQKGFQKTSVDGIDIDYNTNFIQVGLGTGVRL